MNGRTPQFLEQATDPKILALKNKYVWACAVFIGKGDGIDNLEKWRVEFENPSWPVFCINEAVDKVEPLKLQNPIYAVQFSRGVSRTRIFDDVVYITRREAWTQPETDRIIFSEHETTPEYTGVMNTAFIASWFADYMGADRYLFCGFDAILGRIDYGHGLPYAPLDSRRLPDEARYLFFHLRHRFCRFLFSDDEIWQSLSRYFIAGQYPPE